MDHKKYIADKIKAEGVSAEEVASALAVPPDPKMGDYALPCFKFAKVLRKSPVAIAAEPAVAFPHDRLVHLVEVAGKSVFHSD